MLIWLQNTSAPRRVTFGMMILAAVVEFAPEILRVLRQATVSYYAAIACVVITLQVLTKILPGMYLYPLTPGIAGWKHSYVEPDDIAMDGLQIVRDDGAGVWFSNDITVPQAFPFRQLVHCQSKSDPAQLKQLLRLYYELYSAQYDKLREGRFGYQQHLGKMAFPPHMPAGMQDYSAFPPSRIVGFRFVIESFSKASRERKARQVLWEYHFANDELRKS